MTDAQVAYTYRLHHWWKNRIAQILNRAALVVLIGAGVLMLVTGLLGQFAFPYGLFLLIAVLTASAGVLESESVPRPERVPAPDARSAAE